MEIEVINALKINNEKNIEEIVLENEKIKITLINNQIIIGRLKKIRYDDCTIDCSKKYRADEKKIDYGDIINIERLTNEKETN